MTKPNFSGKWKFNQTKSRLQIPAPDSTVLVIEHTEPVLRITRTHIVGDKIDSFTIDLTTDGAEVELKRDGLGIHACAYWDGDTLVFDTKLVRGENEASNVVRYTLSSDSDSFVADERFRSGELNYDNVWVMDRA